MNKHSDISEEELKEWKKTFAKDGVAYDTDDEYREAIGNFVGFIDALIEIDRSIKERPANTDDGLNELYFLDKDGNKIIL